MIKNISKITLYVNDQDESVKFWTEKCDFEVKVNNEMGPNMRWIEIGPKNSDITFVIYSKELMMKQNPKTSIGHPSVILRTEDIDKAHEYLKNNGVKVDDIQRLPYTNMFTFYDNYENMYILSTT